MRHPNRRLASIAAGICALLVPATASAVSTPEQIATAKSAELEHVRCQIEAQRANMASDAAAATRLHGLLAYEKRIDDAQEWPFDQSTLVRVAAYILIPTVPWFGQAVVQYFVEHMAHG